MNNTCTLKGIDNKRDGLLKEGEGEGEYIIREYISITGLLEGGYKLIEGESIIYEDF